METGIRNKVIAFGVSFIGLVTVFSSFKTIQPGYVGVLFNKMTGSMRVVPQGFAFKIPFFTTVQSYPVALRTYTMVAKQKEGSGDGDDSIDLPTKEGQHIKQDLSVTYNTSDMRAADVFKAFRGQDIEDIESTYVRRTIMTVAQNASGQMSLSDLISSQRDKLQTQIQTVLTIELGKMGFFLDKVNLGASHLPKAIEDQMQNKMAAQQQAQQAEYEFQKQQTLAKAKAAAAEGDAQATLINADAQAKANQKLQQSLTHSLIEYEKVKKWDGKLPQFSGSANALIDFRHAE